MPSRPGHLAPPFFNSAERSGLVRREGIEDKWQRKEKRGRGGGCANKSSQNSNDSTEQKAVEEKEKCKRENLKPSSRVCRRRSEYCAGQEFIPESPCAHSANGECAAMARERGPDRSRWRRNDLSSLLPLSERSGGFPWASEMHSCLRKAPSSAERSAEERLCEQRHSPDRR